MSRNIEREDGADLGVFFLFIFVLSSVVQVRNIPLCFILFILFCNSYSLYTEFPIKFN